MRWLLALICLSFATLSPASSLETLNGKPVEKILVLKSVRQLQLINDGKPLKTYRISLGRNPKGAKLVEGDRPNLALSGKTLLVSFAPSLGQAGRDSSRAVVQALGKILSIPEGD